MGNTTWTSPMAGTADPVFRAWGGGISNALAAIGMVRVEASTVATNWNTVISGYATTPNTELAWEVWRFPNSATQTASPLFIRLGYGIGSSASTPMLTYKVSVAQGSGGVTTGIGGMVATNAIPGGVTSTTTATNYAACDDHGLVIVHGIDHVSLNSYRWALVIDRPRNPDGTPLTSGVYVARTSYGSNQVISMTLDIVANEATSYSGTAPCVTQSGLSTTSPNLNGNNQTQVYPWHVVFKNGHGVCKMVATYALVDMIALGLQPVTWLPAATPGTTRTLRPLGTFMTNNAFDIHSSQGAALAMWWAD